MELPKPGESYINPNHLERERYLGRITLWAFIGISGAGKTTLMNELEKRYPDEFKKVVGYTNRPIRPNEIDGNDYHFLTTEQMTTKLKNGEFLQLECLPSGDTYGTSLGSYQEGAINMFAVAAQALHNFRSYGFKDIKGLPIIPESHEVWKERLKKQNIPADKIPKRIEEAIFSYETVLNDDDMTFILSDSIPDTLDRLIQAKQNQPVWHEDLARIVAKNNLDKLKLGIN